MIFQKKGVWQKVETTIKVSPALYLYILRQAIEKGLSVVELLEQVFYQKGENLHPNSREQNLDNVVEVRQNDK